MPALHWKNTSGTTVQCLLCQHKCIIAAGKKGLCGVRENAGGVLHSHVANRVASIGLDPVEKKPLYHYKPGTKTYSIGTAGCNFSCMFCQNHALSRAPIDEGVIPGKITSADILVKEALKHKAQSISFTYNEPTIFTELMTEIAIKARLNDLDCILVSNGYQSLECLASLYDVVRAANIDLKAMRERYYKVLCGARLAPVLENLKMMAKMGWWLEITTLLVPGYNDSDEELRDLARFIHDELGPHVPWHISRFHGAYKLRNAKPTPQATLEKAMNIGLDVGLKYVYIGNTDGMMGTMTICPDCKTVCIARKGFMSKNSLKRGCCPKCKRKIEGVW